MNRQETIDFAKAELEDARVRGHLWPTKMKTVVNAIKSGVEDNLFTLEEVGTSTEELDTLLQKVSE